MFLFLLSPAGPLHAQTQTIPLRAGVHPGFGRLVLDLPPGASAHVLAQGGHLAVQASGAGFGPPPDRLPPNLVHLDLAGALATLTLAPAVTWRSWRLGDRLVIDLFDAPLAPSPPPPARVLWAGPPPRPHPPAAPPPAPAAPPVPPAPPPAAVAATAAPPLPAGPLAIAATLDGRTLALPFAPSTGAAAFREDGAAVVVFDEPRPLDLSALRNDPTFGAAQVQVLPAATLLRLPLAAGTTLFLARDGGGWRLTAIAETDAPPLIPLRPEPQDGRLLLPATGVGRVLSVPDPATGAPLLVGTLRAPGEAVPVARRMADVALRATLLGVAVEPLADTTVLRAAKPGFVLEGAAAQPLALAAEDPTALAAADAARLTRRWDFPPLPLPALHFRLQVALDDAAAALPQVRSTPRLAAAQAMLALGLDAEAGALARLVRDEDARQAETPDPAGLAAVAALLQNRPQDAAAIDDARLNGSDEVALWRAVRRAETQEGAPEAATVFAATLPLLLAYPAPLRDRLLPLAAETMALGGERAAAERLLAARAGDPRLDLARALLDEAEGHSAPALARYDRLAKARDRLTRARAAVRAVALRHRSGAFTDAQAADALDRLVYAWRGDRRELAVRLQVASWRTAAGQWRAALALLRETADGPAAASWPDRVPDVRARMRAVFAEAMAADGRNPLAPFELVTLLDENPDLLPEGEAGQTLAVRLADRLAALDLPARAAALLQKLVDASPPGATRAELGTRLAAWKLEQGDATGTLTALSASVAEGLPPALTERRTLLFARATAARGQIGPAIAALAMLDTTAAADERAALLEGAKEWPAAEAALADLARRTLPDSGPLDAEAGRSLLRLASAAAQAGDEAMLAQVRREMLPRLAPGKLADMLRLLTEQPVKDVPDLPRAAQEANLARALPADLGALGWTAAPERH